MIIIKNQGEGTVFCTFESVEELSRQNRHNYEWSPEHFDCLLYLTNKMLKIKVRLSKQVAGKGESFLKLSK